MGKYISVMTPSKLSTARLWEGIKGLPLFYNICMGMACVCAWQFESFEGSLEAKWAIVGCAIIIARIITWRNNCLLAELHKRCGADAPSTAQKDLTMMN